MDMKRSHEPQDRRARRLGLIDDGAMRKGRTQPAIGACAD
jgi:hypothetical protein